MLHRMGRTIRAVSMGTFPSDSRLLCPGRMVLYRRILSRLGGLYSRRHFRVIFVCARIPRTFEIGGWSISKHSVSDSFRRRARVDRADAGAGKPVPLETKSVSA